MRFVILQTQPINVNYIGRRVGLCPSKVNLRADELLAMICGVREILVREHGYFEFVVSRLLIVLSIDICCGWNCIRQKKNSIFAKNKNKIYNIPQHMLIVSE